MRKTVTFLLALCMIITCSMALAVPEDVAYVNTRRFLEYLEASDLSYTYYGLDEDADEWVGIGFDNDIEVDYFFTEDNGECNIRLWNMMELKPESVEAAYRICNELNSSYKWCKFSVDTSDNTITMAIDLILRDNDDAGEICLEALIHLVRIYEIGYEALKDLAV